jgi:hypothetical protein
MNTVLTHAFVFDWLETDQKEADPVDHEDHHTIQDMSVSKAWERWDQ